MIRTLLFGITMSVITIAIASVGFIAFLVLLPFRKIRQDVIHLFASAWGACFMFLAGAKTRIEGLENFEKGTPYIIMGNHQSPFDIFLFFQIFFGRQFRWISKEGYFKAPVIGFFMKQAGYVSIKREKNRSAYESILQAGTRLEEGKSVAIFPEGTRSKDGVLRPFKSGIIRLVQSHPNIPILPVAFHGTINIMRKGEFRVHKAKTIVHVLKPIMLEELPEDSNEAMRFLEALMRNEHEKIIQELTEK